MNENRLGPRHTFRQRAIFEKDEVFLHTVTTQDVSGQEIVAFSEQQPVDDYLLKLETHYPEKKFVVMDLAAAVDCIERNRIARYCQEWKLITSEEWREALNVLPPEAWGTVAGVNIFRMCEYLTGPITAYYASWAGKFVKANRNIFTPHAEIAEQVKTFIRNNVG